MKTEIKQIESEFKKDLPEIRVGDTVRASLTVREGNKERQQAFEGVVLSMRGEGISKTIKIRKISFGIGVERTVLINSPKLANITVLKKGKARRAKIFYLRGRVGKTALKVKTRK